MLKCNIDKQKKIVRIKAKGTPHDLNVEATVLIRDIYHHIHEQAPAAAQAFKNELIGTLLDPNSPVWKEETNNG